MCIENHFNYAEVYLEMANEKFNNLDFDGTLAALAKSYTYIRNLIDEVFVMKNESTQTDRPAGED